MMPSHIPRIGSPGSLILLFTPRSGSTLLAEYLARAGIARPREWFQETSYLNNASIALAGPPLPLLAERAAEVTAEAAPDGRFATKLSWNQVMMLALTCGSLDPVDVLPAMFGDATYVYLTRRHAIDQAISLHFAAVADKWHHDGDLSAYDRVAYDFEAIYRDLVQAAYAMAQFEDLFGRTGISPIRICHEDLVRAPGEAVARLATACGALAGPVGEAPLRRLDHPLKQAYARRFAADLRGGCRSVEATLSPFWQPAGRPLATRGFAGLRPLRRIDLHCLPGGDGDVSLQTESCFPDGAALRLRAGATLRLDIDAGAAAFTFLKHAWSGRVIIDHSGRRLEVDLFSESWSAQAVTLLGAGGRGVGPVEIRAQAGGPNHAPREEIWLQRVVSGDPL